MSRSYTSRLSSIYSKQISTSRKISRGSTLTNNPQRSDINNGQNKGSVLDTNSKEKILEEKIIKKCYGCKRFNISHHSKPSHRLIPTDTTKQDLPYSDIGTDYAGPFICKIKGKQNIYVKQKEREISKFIYCGSPVA